MVQIILTNVRSGSVRLAPLFYPRMDLGVGLPAFNAVPRLCCCHFEISSEANCFNGLCLQNLSAYGSLTHDAVSPNIARPASTVAPVGAGDTPLNWLADSWPARRPQ